MYLDGNDLSGTIPTEVGQLTGLRKQKLATKLWTFVSLADWYCSSFIQRVVIDELILLGNDLTGTVPTELGRCRDMSKLYISG